MSPSITFAAELQPGSSSVLMGANFRLETSTSAQVLEPYLGLSLALGHRWTEVDTRLEYQELHRKESNLGIYSVGSADREIFAFVDRRVAAFSSERFRTGVGLGVGALIASSRTRFQNTLIENTSQSDLLFKVGVALEYAIKGFLIGIDGRLHFAKNVSDRVMPEMLLRLGSRF